MSATGISLSTYPRYAAYWTIRLWLQKCLGWWSGVMGCQSKMILIDLIVDDLLGYSLIWIRGANTLQTENCCTSNIGRIEEFVVWRCINFRSVLNHISGLNTTQNRNYIICHINTKFLSIFIRSIDVWNCSKWVHIFYYFWYYIFLFAEMVSTKHRPCLNIYQSSCANEIIFLWRYRWSLVTKPIQRIC